MNFIMQTPDIPKLNREVRIAVAKDEAFCFYYQDNLELLQDVKGKKLIEFSPLHDKELPKDTDGILLGGGYPELVADKLSSNESMRASIRTALNQKMPCLAECRLYVPPHSDGGDIPGQGLSNGWEHCW